MDQEYVCRVYHGEKISDEMSREHVHSAFLIFRVEAKRMKRARNAIRRMLSTTKNYARCIVAIWKATRNEVETSS